MKANQGYIFARVSTTDQFEDEHFGIPVQAKRLEEYAERNEIKILDMFKFPESAFRGKRKKFREALTKVFRYQEEQEETMALLFDDEDRLTRRAISDVMVDIEKLREEGKIELHFRASNKVIHRDSSDGDILTFRIKCDVAEHESRSKRRRVKDTILYKLQQGQFPGFAPTGYLNDPANKTLVPDPERAEGIKKMFKLYATDDYSGSELAKILRADGLTIKPTAGNEPRLMAKGDVIRLLNKRAFTGEFNWEGITYKGNYKGLISKKLFNDVQEVLKERATKYGATHRKTAYSSTKFLKFRGVLSCGFCDCTMTGQNQQRSFKDKREYIQYRCTHGRKSTQHDWYEKEFGTKHSGVRIYKGKKTINCPQKMWYEKEIDEAIKRELEALAMDKKVIKKIKEDLEVDFTERMTASETQRKVLEAEVVEKDRLRKALIKKLALEEHSDVALDIQEVVNETKDQIETIKERIASLEETEEANVNEVVKVLSLCSDLAEQYDNLTPANQRKLVMTAFKRITLRKGEVEGKKFNSIDVAWTEPFWMLHEKWFNKAWKEDKKKGGPSMMGGGGGGTIKINMRVSDKGGPEDCLSTGKFIVIC